MKKITVILSVVLLMFTDTSYAQQDAMYSQYLFNPFIINPAYAGSRESFSSVLLYRDQWSGIDGSPKTSTFSMHGPMKNKRVALGAQIMTDQIGPTNNLSAMMTYAYHLELGPGKLSMALRGGFYNSRLDVNKLQGRDQEDFSNLGSVDALAPSFDFGMYYYTNRFFAGVSSTHLTQQRLGYNNFPADANVHLNRHYFANIGGVFEMGENVLFRPSALIKYVEGAPVNVDVNSSFLLYKTVWLGASYRINQAMVFMMELNITEQIRLGYSYDYLLDPMQNVGKGAHELFIGYDFQIFKDRTVSPRYL